MKFHSLFNFNVSGDMIFALKIQIESTSAKTKLGKPQGWEKERERAVAPSRLKG